MTDHPAIVAGAVIPDPSAAEAERDGSPPAKGGRFDLAFLVLLCALPPLSIDMGLPALPDVAAGLGTGAAGSALTVSLFMAGFAVTPLAYGLLSDRHGRRPLLVAGLGLFALGGIGAALAPSIGWLLLARLVQGAGAGAGPTLAFAATRDRLQGVRMARRLAILTMLLNTAPIVAPSLGTAVLALGGWRGIYGSLALGGFALLAVAIRGFVETRPRQALAADRRGLFATLVRDAAVLRSRPDVLAPGAVYGLSAGSMFAYVSTSPLLLIQRLGATPALYAGLFAVTACGIVSGACLSGRALRVLPAGRVVLLGLCLSLAGPAAAGCLLLAGQVGLLPVVACMAVATFGYGLVAPAAAQATLDPLPGMAGVAAAFMTSFQMICMSVSSLFAALLLSRLGAVAIPVTMAGFALASAFCLTAGRMVPASGAGSCLGDTGASFEPVPG